MKDREGEKSDSLTGQLDGWMNGQTDRQTDLLVSGPLGGVRSFEGSGS